MPKLQGQFVWCDLMTTDVAAATAFYQAAIRWRAQPAPPPNEAYTVLSANEAGVGGIMAMPPAARDAGRRPGWMGYIGADDVDAMAARVTAAGGTIHHAPSDIPGVGRFAVAADPQGAVFNIFKPNGTDAPPPPAASTPGLVGWRELHAADWEKAFAFYAGLFGWTRTEAIDMKEMGIYQTFATDTEMAGGMMTGPDAAAPPFWLYYFNVDAIDAAVTRATDAGGTLLHGPMQVPGGSWIAQFQDPQGAMFAMVAPLR